jgi:hypothetical protein
MSSHLVHLAQSYNYDTTGESSAVGLLVGLAIGIFVIACLWRIFTKAGEPGWASIVPIYNYYVILKIVGRPWWWLLLYLIPFVNIIILIIVMIDLAKAFGKSGAFAAGLIFLGFIFFPILAFGSATYQGAPAH